MTGREVLNRAMQLLGYTNGYGEVDGLRDAELMKRGTTAVDQILTDLRRIESPGWTAEGTVNLDAPLPLSPDAAKDAMTYGVAMLLAQGESDGDAQGLFAQLYYRKRAGVKAPASRRADVLPRVNL